jgi:prepilin peptidase CpaA
VNTANSEFRALIDLLSMLLLDRRTGVLIGLLVLAALNDYRTRRIPNLLVLCGTGLAFLLNTLDTGASTIGFIGALQGLAVGFAVMLPFYLLRAMGAGDVKLMAMTGAFLGLPQTIWAVLATFLAGGLLAVGYLLWHGTLRQALLNVVSVLQSFVFAAAGGVKPSLALSPQTSTGSLPYGVAIATGTTGYLVARQLGWLG